MHDKRTFTLALLILAAVTMAGTIASANDLPAPKGEIILSVTGKITRTNAPGRADFDRDMLNALGRAELRTTHSWADTATHFEGVRAAALLDAVGAQGTRIRAEAINHYAIELNVAELRRYPVLLALSADGTELRRRDRGPIWIVYPRDDYPELRPEKQNYKWIWQLRSLDIQ